MLSGTRTRATGQWWRSAAPPVSWRNTVARSASSWSAAPTSSRRTLWETAVLSTVHSSPRPSTVSSCCFLLGGGSINLGVPHSDRPVLCCSLLLSCGRKRHIIGRPSLRLPHVVLQPAVVLWGKRDTSWEGPHLKCHMLCYSLALIKISHLVLQPAYMGKRSAKLGGPHLKCPMLCYSVLLQGKEVQDWEALI